jgi:hypothetical protein
LADTICRALIAAMQCSFYRIVVLCVEGIAGDGFSCLANVWLQVFFEVRIIPQLLVDDVKLRKIKYYAFPSYYRHHHCQPQSNPRQVALRTLYECAYYNDWCPLFLTG